MTTGALIFAFNNEETDYIGMAAWSAQNIGRHLGLPTAIVTDCDPGDPRVSGFDRVITADASSGGTRYFEDYKSSITWYNAGRTDAYNLSPWDKTLVLDADYVVASADLKKVIEADCDFMCYRHALDMCSGEYMTELNYFGTHKMPMWWATVMSFRRSNTTAYIFDCMQMVRENWQHYRDLYGIQKSTYRNDYALSIAIGIVSGHTGVIDEIPWPLCSITPSTKLEQNEQDSYTLTYTNAQKQLKTMMFNGMDFHAMGKRDLGEIIEADRRERLLDSSPTQQPS